MFENKKETSNKTEKMILTNILKKKTHMFSTPRVTQVSINLTEISHC